MTNLLIKLFVKDSKNTSDPAVRKRYGYLGAFTGIVLNILLFLGKLIAGILSGGISVIADAFNNLSDAGSSIMTFVGFKMAGMPADSEHPYGHGRMEYVSGIIISFIIMMMGFELGKSLSLIHISVILLSERKCCSGRVVVLRAGNRYAHTRL